MQPTQLLQRTLPTQKLAPTKRPIRPFRTRKGQRLGQGKDPEPTRQGRPGPPPPRAYGAFHAPRPEVADSGVADSDVADSDVADPDVADPDVADSDPARA